MGSSAQLPQPGFVHWFCVRLIRLWVMFGGVKVSGRENLSIEGPCVVCSNHVTEMDPFVIGSLFSRPVYYIAKIEILEVAWKRYLMKVAMAIMMDRDHPSRESIAQCRKVLREGGFLGVFPEGTRNKKRRGLLPFHEGAALFAKKENAPLLPIHISWKRGRATIVVGPVISPDEYEDRSELTEHLRLVICQLKDYQEV